MERGYYQIGQVIHFRHRFYTVARHIDGEQNALQKAYSIVISIYESASKTSWLEKGLWLQQRTSRKKAAHMVPLLLGAAGLLCYCSH